MSDICTNIRIYYILFPFLVMILFEKSKFNTLLSFILLIKSTLLFFYFCIVPQNWLFCLVPTWNLFFLLPLTTKNISLPTTLHHFSYVIYIFVIGSLTPATESRPPTSDSTKKDLHLDVGVRLKAMRKIISLISRTPTAKTHCFCNQYQVGGRHPGSPTTATESRPPTSYATKKDIHLDVGVRL